MGNPNPPSSWYNPPDEPPDPLDSVDLDEFYANELDEDEREQVDACETDNARYELLGELWHQHHDNDGNDCEDREPPSEPLTDRDSWHYPWGDKYYTRDG